MKGISVIKDETRLNKDDVLEFDTYSLGDKNDLKDNLILLYVYYLLDDPLYGYKVGMTKCKLGETFWSAIQERIKHQENELHLSKENLETIGKTRVVCFWGICLNDRDDDFQDHRIHDEIKEQFPAAEKEYEWFYDRLLTLDVIKNAFYEYRNSTEPPYKIYKPRYEQGQAIEKMKKYFSNEGNNGRFLLNCKMRFGKCYTMYKYAEKTGKNKIIILTFVPAVEEEWKKNLHHIEKVYDYFTDKELDDENFRLNDDPQTPYVVFLSLQNYLGKDSKSNATKEKIKKLQGIHFDLLILDEYHFGAWNDRTQETIEDFDDEYQKNLGKQKTGLEIIDRFKISVNQTVCLSGTPFKALDRGDFLENNSYSYSYFDEQKNKYPNSDKNDFATVNPDYEQFPDMKIYGYNMASLFSSNVYISNWMVKDKLVATDHPHPLFSLNKFFETRNDKNNDEPCTFVYEEEISNWLSTLYGAKYEENYKFPYQYDQISDVKDSLWLMPTITACIAMANLLKENAYFKNFEIINLSDPSVGAGTKALKVLKQGLKKAQDTSKIGTISLTVNKLTLGVTVEEWRAVFVLKDLSSPEQYFQSIFRVQNPQLVDGKPIKKVCKVYDFNIDRATTLLLQYADKSEQSANNLQIADLIVKYMPIYLNGNVDTPISKDVFYKLAKFGDTTKQSLSQKITNTSRTTHADDQTITNMLNDDDCRKVMDKVFAHARFKSPTNKTIPMGERNEKYKKTEYLLGQDLGYKEGNLNSYKFGSLDNCQKQVEESYESLFVNRCPADYSDEQKVWFHNGIADGYLKGINAPIQKLRCGREDGIKFIETIRRNFGENIKYTSQEKTRIDSFVADYLNDSSNIPAEYRGQLYMKWYKISFKNAVAYGLTDHQNSNAEKGVEDVENILKHILARLFQFLYISVYRETTFEEIFNNADPGVFLSAVGISKDEFQTLNKYHIFNEEYLNSCIHDFFVNETLGQGLSDEEKEDNDYRNSFNWFGYGVDK